MEAISARISLKAALILLLCYPQLLLAQLSLKSNSHQFGVMYQSSPRYADIEVRNEGNDEALLFRVEVPRYVEVKFSSKSIAPSSSEYIRFHINPREAGPFDIEAKVYASPWSEPRLIRLQGESTFASSYVPCPDFSSVPGSSRGVFTLSLRDARGEPIPNAVVRSFSGGRSQATARSSDQGELSFELPSGPQLLSIALGDRELDTLVYLPSYDSYLAWELPFAVQGLSAKIEPASIEREKLEDVPDKSMASDTDSEPDSKRMPRSKFKQNNVVFLVDVSTSMRQQNRLELLKISMIDLLEALRDDDRFALISYASDTQVLIEAREGLNRDEAAELISSLEAKGATEGAKAIRSAGRLARKQYLPEGNNQVILATDGAFNEGAAQAKRLVNKYRRSGVLTSVLCIRCGAFTSKEMGELVEVGGGRMVPIDSAGDAGEKLIEEIKRSALR